MAFSSFDDKAAQPTDTEVAAELGPTFEFWGDLKTQIAARFDPLAEEWTFSGQKWGWSLRLKHKKRAVLYMTPQSGAFVVGFVLGEKAVSAAQQSGISRSIVKVIDASEKFAEGRGVRLEVRDAATVEDMVKIAEIKMAN
jgi:hypothetical protein